jgi:hypothetical protein
MGSPIRMQSGILFRAPNESAQSVFGLGLLMLGSIPPHRDAHIKSTPRSCFIVRASWQKDVDNLVSRFHGRQAAARPLVRGGEH